MCINVCVGVWLWVCVCIYIQWWSSADWVCGCGFITSTPLLCVIVQCNSHTCTCTYVPGVCIVCIPGWWNVVQELSKDGSRKLGGCQGGQHAFGLVLTKEHPLLINRLSAIFFTCTRMPSTAASTGTPCSLRLVHYRRVLYTAYIYLHVCAGCFMWCSDPCEC